jgi:phosphohistidine phosphatase
MDIMKTLLLMRHAKSSWDHPDLDDHERPLNKRGQHDAPRMGELLEAEDLLPDLILVSSAARAQETMRLLVEACGYDGPVETHHDLYYSDVDAYLRILQHLPETVTRPLLIGHNPDVDELLRMLTGVGRHMPTAALALIELPKNTWGELVSDKMGQLRRLWEPREVK